MLHRSFTNKDDVLFWHQYRAFFIIYNLTNNCTIISNTIITNSMLLHNIYAVQQDTQSVLMSELIQHLC